MNEEAAKTETPAVFMRGYQIIDVLMVIAGSALAWLAGRFLVGGGPDQPASGADFRDLLIMNLMLTYLMQPGVLITRMRRVVGVLLSATIVGIVTYLLYTLFAL